MIILAVILSLVHADSIHLTGMQSDDSGKFAILKLQSSNPETIELLANPDRKDEEGWKPRKQYLAKKNGELLVPLSDDIENNMFYCFSHETVDKQRIYTTPFRKEANEYKIMSSTATVKAPEKMKNEGNCMAEKDFEQDRENDRGGKNNDEEDRKNSNKDESSIDNSMAYLICGVIIFFLVIVVITILIRG